MCMTFGAIYSIPNKNKTSGREKAQGDKHWNAVTLTHPAHTHTQPTQRWNTISNHYTCTSDPLGSPAAYLRWSKIVVGFAKLKFHHSKADEKKGTKTSSLKAEVFSALDFPRGYYYDEKKGGISTEIMMQISSILGSRFQTIPRELHQYPHCPSGKSAFSHAIVLKRMPL